MTKIKIENLTKIFGPHPKRALEMLDQGMSKAEILRRTGSTVGVNKASFEIDEGEFFVIMGLSGSGKSTLVRLFNRLIEPTSGKVLIDGVNLVTMTNDQLRSVRRKKMSMVFQNFALFPHYTVLENTEYGLEIQNVDKEIRRKKAIEALTLVGLAGYEHSMPSELSGGMQQRVGLARALASDADILLMDEAFSALDPLIRKDMQDELIEIQENMKKTIVFITHDLDEALRLGDRIALMRDGQVVQLGTPEEIMMNPANEYVEKFVADVDLSKVLTASNVMIKAETMTSDRGPRVALQLMKDRGISNIFIVDRRRKLQGVVLAQDAKQAVKDKKGLEDIIIRDIPKASPDEILNDLYDMAAHTIIPISVVDDSGRLLGVIIRGAIMEALSRNSHDEEAASEYDDKVYHADNAETENIEADNIVLDNRNGVL